MKSLFNYDQKHDLRETKMARGLRANGYKLTPQRLAVLQVIQGGNEHLTPAEVLERGRGIYPRLGLTTVYRTLDLLSELGFVRRVHVEEGCHGYARAEERDGHHLVCQNCHRVVDFPCFGLGELIEELGRRTGFAVESHLLELGGLCPICQEHRIGSEQEIGA
jgi:Fur family ferric uptake transcriptional regulator